MPVTSSPIPSPVLELEVLGLAQPAGSKRAFRHPKTGRPIVTDANRNSKPWQAEVKAAAVEVMDRVGLELICGPLAVEFTFIKPRPKGHFRTGAKAHLLRPSAPVWPSTRPDVLKLARGVEDALTGVVWRDDAQIVEEYLFKRYGSPPGCRVRVWHHREET